jgi:glutathione S-transferase
VIRLHLFPRVNGWQPSPPCAKVESYLQLTGTPYERAESWDIERAPKKKFPFIEDGANVVPDSWFILRYLEGKQTRPLDGDLDRRARVRSHALGRVLDESLYYAIGYFRWLEPEGYELAKEAMFGALPPAERDASAEGVREIARNMMHYQGFGRHRPEELMQMVEADLDCVEMTLGEQPFLLGDTPRCVDCSGYGILGVMLSTPVAPCIPQAVRRRPTLVDYVERMEMRLRSRE